MTGNTAGTNFNVFYALVSNAPEELKMKLKIVNTKFSVCLLLLFHLIISNKFKLYSYANLFKDLEIEQ